MKEESPAFRLETTVVDGVEVHNYNPNLAHVDGTGESMLEMFMEIVNSQPDADEMKKRLSGNVYIANT